MSRGRILMITVAKTPIIVSLANELIQRNAGVEIATSVQSANQLLDGLGHGNFDVIAIIGGFNTANLEPNGTPVIKVNDRINPNALLAEIAQVQVKS